MYWSRYFVSPRPGGEATRRRLAHPPRLTPPTTYAAYAHAHGGMRGRAGESAVQSVTPAFYMYTTSELPLAHDELRACMDAMGAARREQLLDDQHTTGYWLHAQLADHPARVRTPDDARLFVVPFWMKLSWLLGKCSGVDHLERVRRLLLALKATPAFRHTARRHLLSSSSFMQRIGPMMPRYAARQRNPVDGPFGCMNPWAPTPTPFHYFPPEGEEVLARLTIAHMERFSPSLCASRLPANRSRFMYANWPQPWWDTRTLVLPYVVDAKTTAAALHRNTASFEYAQWVRRPHTFFFAGNAMREGGAPYVRLSLTRLNEWEETARIHCSGLTSARALPWRDEVAEYEARTRAGAGVHTTVRGSVSTAKADDERNDILRWRALRGELCRPPLTKAEVLSTMLNSKFCICPRGDSPSTSRVYFALAVGCIPIVVSDPWGDMAAPFSQALINLSAVVLRLEEQAVLDAPEAAMQALLEGAFDVSLRDGAKEHARRQRGERGPATGKRRLRFPMPGTVAAMPLEAHLRAMARVHRVALWRAPGNRLIAHLALASALRLVSKANSRKGQHVQH